MAGGVDRLQAAHIHRAKHAQRGPGRLLEGQLQVSVHSGGGEAQRQAGGQVAEVGLEVEPGQVEGGIGLERIGKRQCLRAGAERAAIDHEAQPRHHLHGPFVRQVADEGQAQIQLAHLVHAAHGAVVEVDRAARQLDVVDREALRLRGLRARRAGRQAPQDVVDVVMAVAVVAQVQHRLLDAHGVHHRHQPPQRGQRGVGVQPPDGQLRALPAGTGHGDVVQRQLQRPGFEVDLADAHLPAELLAGDLLALPLEQRRHGGPGQRPESQQAGHGIDQPAQPPVGRQPAAARRRIHSSRRTGLGIGRCACAGRGNFFAHG